MSAQELAQHRETAHYDILIVGGGLAGAALACVLGQTRWRIGVLEPGTHGDRRAIALSASSERIFRALDLWPAMASKATAIRMVHVSQQGRPGITRLRAADAGVPALGQVLFHGDILAALHGRLRALERVDLLAGMRATGLGQQGPDVALHALGPDGPRKLHAALVVAADGPRSALRDALGIVAEVTDYGQRALVCEVATTRDHVGVAYERFTAEGPMALLPVGQRRCALVWARPETQAQAMAAWPRQRLSAALQAAFGYRLGRLAVDGPVGQFPLRMLRAARNVEGSVVLLGNAAHALHPVAAQGFNLALREVALLGELLYAQWRAGESPGSGDVLMRFARRFAADLERTARFTDVLARLFTTPGIGPIRSGALIGLELLPALKRRLARQGMGLYGPVPRLVAGIPLEEDGRCTLTW